MKELKILFDFFAERKTRLIPVLLATAAGGALGAAAFYGRWRG